jgi:hypothetical protein
MNLKRLSKSNAKKRILNKIKKIKKLKLIKRKMN